MKCSYFMKKCCKFMINDVSPPKLTIPCQENEGKRRSCISRLLEILWTYYRKVENENYKTLLHCWHLRSTNMISSWMNPYMIYSENAFGAPNNLQTLQRKILSFFFFWTLIQFHEMKNNIAGFANKLLRCVDI